MAAVCAPVLPFHSDNNSATAERRNGRGERSPDAARGRRGAGRAVVIPDQGRRGDDLVCYENVLEFGNAEKESTALCEGG